MPRQMLQAREILLYWRFFIQIRNIKIELFERFFENIFESTAELIDSTTDLPVNSTFTTPPPTRTNIPSTALQRELSFNDMSFTSDSSV